MNAKAKRIHSLKRLLWALTIVNLIAVLLLFTYWGVTSGYAGSSIAEIRPAAAETEEGQRLLLVYDRLRDRYGRVTMWISLLLLGQIVVYTLMDRRLAREIRNE